MIKKLLEKIVKNSGAILPFSKLEDFLLKEEISEIEIKSPVYITGLARSGTTIVLNLLSRNSKFGCHRYYNFPYVVLPYIWGNLISKRFSKDTELKERDHKDGLMVNAMSPESMEEILWEYYFNDIHNPEKSNILDDNIENKGFISFYEKHIKKLLYCMKGNRYLSKANYNLSRTSYILKNFPDAKFIIMYRDPVSYVYSSMKQHKLFKEQQETDKSLIINTDLGCHYEFGLHQKLINFGSSEKTRQIIEYVQDEQKEHIAWALYWVQAYQFALEEYNKHKTNLKLVSYDKLCDSAPSIFSEICNFIGEDAEIENNKLLSNISAPNYYNIALDAEKLKEIKEITENTLNHLNAINS